MLDCGPRHEAAAVAVLIAVDQPILVSGGISGFLPLAATGVGRDTPDLDAGLGGEALDHFRGQSTHHAVIVRDRVALLDGPLLEFFHGFHADVADAGRGELLTATATTATAAATAATAATTATPTSATTTGTAASATGTAVAATTTGSTAAVIVTAGTSASTRSAATAEAITHGFAS